MSSRSMVRRAGACALALLILACGIGAGPAEAPRYPDHARLLVVRDATGNEQPVRSPGEWQVRRAHILAHLQDVMGRLPGGERRVPLDVQTHGSVDEPLYKRWRISFASEPGDRVPAWLLVPKGEIQGGKRPAMLCLHQTIAIGKDEPAVLGGKPNLHYAHELAERGYVALAPDYPNFGDYRLDPYALGYASASMKAIWNNLRAIDVLTERPDVDADRLGVIGHSLGGHNAIFTALFDERLKAVVSSCGFNSFRDYYKGDITGWSHKGYMPRLKEVYQLDLDKVPFDFPELIGALAPRAFFTNSPLHDSNFDVEGVRTCIKSAGAVYRLLGATDRLDTVYPDAEHDFPPDARQSAYAFLDRLLKPR